MIPEPGNIAAEMPSYPIPPRNSRSMPGLLLQVLRPVAAPALRQFAHLIGLLWMLTFLPFVVIGWALYVIFVTCFVFVPQVVYNRLTGRQAEWIGRVMPFSREGKMSPAEMMKRRLGNRD